MPGVGGIQPIEALLIRARAALRGEPRESDDLLLAALRTALGATAAAPPTWWQRRDRAELQLVLGQHLQAMARDAEAAELIGAAIAGFAAVQLQSRDVLGQQRLAHARVELAALTLADGGPGTTVTPLLDAAEEWYRYGGPAYRWRVTDIERMRGRLAAAPLQ